MLRLRLHAPVAAILALGLTASAAEAKCTRLAFSVNDYGKDGPIKDAKELLDKYIADWAKQRNIGKYTVGKKDVSCELFLDFVVFDEHTCKAEATVCWPDGGRATSSATTASIGASKTDKAAPALKKAPSTKPATAQ